MDRDYGGEHFSVGENVKERICPKKLDPGVTDDKYEDPFRPKEGSVSLGSIGTGRGNRDLTFKGPPSSTQSTGEDTWCLDSCGSFTTFMCLKTEIKGGE